MSRDTCISHRPSNICAIVREDYYELMDRDAVAAALLNIFEYWGNAAIAINPKDLEPDLGQHPISEFEHLLLGISTDKQIRLRLKKLEERGFIEISNPKPAEKLRSGQAPKYKFFIKRVQKALNKIGQATSEPRSNDRTTSVKQPTEPRSNDRTTSVKQPTEPRSNDRASIYKKDLKNKEELSLLEIKDFEVIRERVPDPYFGRQRQPIAVPVTQKFQGPWGVGCTPEQKEFDSWLQDQARAKNMVDPASWAFKIIDSIAKGGPQSKWEEFQAWKQGEVLKPGTPLFHPNQAQWLREMDEVGPYEFAEAASTPEEYKTRLKFAQQILRERENATA